MRVFVNAAPVDVPPGTDDRSDLIVMRRTGYLLDVAAFRNADALLHVVRAFDDGVEAEQEARALGERVQHGVQLLLQKREAHGVGRR